MLYTEAKHGHKSKKIGKVWRCLKCGAKGVWRELDKKNSNGEVLHLVEESGTLLNHLEIMRGKVFGHRIRHDNYIKTIAEGQVEANRGRERLRRAYVDQLKERNVV